MFKNKKGFTMIELLIVIAILAVLVLFAVPRYLSYVKDANVGAMKTDAKVIHTAIENEYAKQASRASNVKIDELPLLGGAPGAPASSAGTAGAADPEVVAIKEEDSAGVVKGIDLNGAEKYNIDATSFEETGTRLKNEIGDYQVYVQNDRDILVVFPAGVEDSEGGMFYTNLQKTGKQP